MRRVFWRADIGGNVVTDRSAGKREPMEFVDAGEMPSAAGDALALFGKRFGVRLDILRTDLVQ